MKNSKSCPKCNGTDIVVIKNDGHPEGPAGNNIMCGPTRISSVVKIERYICCGCGYTEEWVDKTGIQTLLKSKKIQKIT